jgi:molybdenum cofactor cytidylyltransferase
MTCAIVPAAGSSRRMGRPKLLLPFGRATVVEAVLATLRDAGVARTVVVIAAGDGALRSLARGAGAEVAVNHHPERGMLSSVVAGIEALGGAATLASAGDALLVTPADLPTLRPATVERLIASLEAGGAPLAVPTYLGKRGHPLALAAELLPEIAALDPGVGLRQLLDRHPVLELPVDDPGVVADVDTPAEYERLRLAATDRGDAPA